MLLAMFVQQQMFPIGKGFDFDKLYIVCGRIVLCSIALQSIVALMPSFYIFKGEVSQD